jgi:hypothetical protein
VPSDSVAGAPLRVLALRRMGAALLVEGPAGGIDVVGEPVDLLAAERLLDEGAQDFHVFRVRRHRVGGEHPATLRRELPGDVELVVVLLSGQPEGDQGQLLLACADQLEVAALPEPVCQCLRVRLHRPHRVGVSLTAEADEVVVLGEHHRGARGEVQSEGGIGLAEVVLVEDEVGGEV